MVDNGRIMKELKELQEAAKNVRFAKCSLSHYVVFSRLIKAFKQALSEIT